MEEYIASRSGRPATFFKKGDLSPNNRPEDQSALGTHFGFIFNTFCFRPLFLFAMAIAVTQCRLWWMNTTMVGRARIENGKHVRKMTLCGGTTGIAGGGR